MPGEEKTHPAEKRREVWTMYTAAEGMTWKDIALELTKDFIEAEKQYKKHNH